MNLPDLNLPVCEWLNLEKKKRIKKIKVKKCVGVTDEVLREKGKKKKKRGRKRALWNVLEFGGSGWEKKRKEGKKKKRK